MITNINPNYSIKEDVVGYVMEDTNITNLTKSLKMYIPLIHPSVSGYNKPIEEEYYLRINSSFVNDIGCQVVYNKKIKKRNYIDVKKTESTEFKRNGISISEDNGVNKIIKKGTKILCKIENGNISYIKFDDSIINYTATDVPVIPEIPESVSTESSIPFIRLLTTGNVMISNDHSNDLFGNLT